MGSIIDTAVIIATERGQADIKELQRTFGPDLLISVITASELLHGVHRASDEMIRRRRLEFVEKALDLFPIIGIDLETARIHARIGAELAVRGEVIGSSDLWQAATSLANDCSLVTSNVKEFKRVTGLVIEEWSPPPA